MPQQILGMDATGYDVLTKAVSELLNQYPGLGSRTITFEELEEESGIAFSADSGALILSEQRFITDHIKQTCQYPFFVVYRTAGTREVHKMNVQTFLDSLGKWLCKEPAIINNQTYTLDAYPDLSGGRKITKVTRNNSYGAAPTDKGVQDWLLPVIVEYTNEFDV